MFFFLLRWQSFSGEWVRVGHFSQMLNSTIQPNPPLRVWLILQKNMSFYPPPIIRGLRKNSELGLKWAAEYERHRIASVSPGCFFTSNWCGAGESLLLSENRQGGGRRGQPGRRDRSCSPVRPRRWERSTLCALRLPDFINQKGRLGLINGQLGGKHLSRHSQCTTRVLFFLESWKHKAPRHTHTHTHAHTENTVGERKP